MSERKQLLADKKAITPLWIVALFVSLTETVLGVAVTQTSGGIQVSLTVFVVFFPLLIAGAFFGILWSKPYVFYPPTEFGSQVSVVDFVDAMQRRPSFLKHDADGQVDKPPTEKEVRAADQIVDSFVSRLATSALLFLYAFSMAYSKRRPVDFVALNSIIGMSPDDTYGMGILSATGATGLLTYTKSVEVFDEAGEKVRKTLGHITNMNEKLQGVLMGGLSQTIQERLKHESFSGWDPEEKREFQSWTESQIGLIGQYFSDPPTELE